MTIIFCFSGSQLNENNWITLKTVVLCGAFETIKQKENPKNQQKLKKLIKERFPHSSLLGGWVIKKFAFSENRVDIDHRLSISKKFAIRLIKTRNYLLLIKMKTHLNPNLILSENPMSISIVVAVGQGLLNTFY